MYYLQPTPEWTAFRGAAQPQQKLDANGQAMFERFPRQGQPARPLLDFLALPDTVSSYLLTLTKRSFDTFNRSVAKRSCGG